ncbi:unnamed protein product [Rotaria sp. Silwood2]|nr:unnamed protein product [Rotaria sp. Silwood2]
MTNKYPIHPEGLNLWQNLYNQSLTIDGKESIIQTDGTKQLVLLPIYDSCSLVFDYTIKLSQDESTTSIPMIAHIIHQIEYMFN